MRRYAQFLVSAVALTALISPGVASGKTGTTKTVTVSLSCPENLETEPVLISVHPWVAVIELGDEIEWDLVLPQGSSDDYIEIEVKKDGKWPFDQKKIKNKKKVKSGQTNGKAKKGEYYSYNIIVACDDEAVIIDPRVRVGGGGSG